MMELSTDTTNGYDDMEVYMEYGFVFVSSALSCSKNIFIPYNLLNMNQYRRAHWQFMKASAGSCNSFASIIHGFVTVTGINKEWINILFTDTARLYGIHKMSFMHNCYM